MDIFTEYAELDMQKKVIEARIKEMRVKVLAKLQEGNTEKHEMGLGTFSMTPTKTWTYPEELIAREEKLKADFALAEQTGDATYEEKPGFRFVSVKIK